MECPNCKKQVNIDQVVYSNCETYHNTNIGKSNCCGIGFYITPVTSFHVRPYIGTKTEDDWGKPIKTYKPIK